MKKPIEKPSPEAKALSLFLMAHKSVNPEYKEKLKIINKQWDLYQQKLISRNSYLKALKKMLDTYGGYAAVVEKTVKFYIDKTGEWKLAGEDQYCLDAREVADKISKK